MPITNPFSTHPPICEVEKCDCCESTILVADTPVFEDEPATAVLRLPTEAMVHEAMEVVRVMTERGSGSREEVLIARLLDAYVLHAELLTRCVIHGRGETGDVDYDQSMLDDALDISHDVIRAGLRTDDAPPEVPESIRLDIGNWATDAGLDRDSRDEDAPTPTIFEA